MAEATQGKQVILLVRRLDEATKKTAAKPLFQIEHTISYERSLNKRRSSKQRWRIRGYIITKRTSF